MASTKYKLGEFLELVSVKCGIDKCLDVQGINIDKNFFPSRNVGENTSKYLDVPPFAFAMNLMHVGRDERLPISLNKTNKTLVVSPAYTVFKMLENNILLLDYLNIIFHLSEFDRYTWYRTDTSIRGNLDWSTFCDIEIELPSIEIQKKYVAIYNAMKENQEVYEKSLADLKLTCDVYIERLIRTKQPKKLKTLIRLLEEKNKDLALGLKNLKGISINKSFIPTKADMEGVSLSSYKLVSPSSFAYVSITSRNGDKISIAHNTSDDTYIVSSSYITFGISSSEILAPKFLAIFFNRSEFDRYARYHSWGSAREAFTWGDLCEFEIPIPNLEVQESIANMYKVYLERKSINDKMKKQIKEICPILIKGALEEAKR